MSLLFQHKTKSAPQVDNPYWMSFSDMMSGMLIIFILVCIALLYKLSQIEDDVNEGIDELNKSIEVRTKILKEMKKELREQIGIIVEITDNDSVLRIPHSSFKFDTGSYEINENLKEKAKKIGEILYTAIKKDDRWTSLETVFIEGHADERDAPEFRHGNWNLSAMRAIELWRFWIDKTDYGIELSDLENLDGKKLFSVSGYAATRPVIKNATNEKEHSQNRRIDIRFTTKQPTIKDLEDVIAPLKEN